MTDSPQKEALPPAEPPQRGPQRAPAYPALTRVPPPALSAQAVADQFKREGHFDRLRKQLVQEFLDSRSSDEFYDRLDDILHMFLDKLVHRARRSYPPRAPWASTQQAYEDSLRELGRHPLLERTLADVDKRQVPRYIDGIDEILLGIIEQKRQTMPPPPLVINKHEPPPPLAASTVGR